MTLRRLNTFAYCLASQRQAVGRAARTAPLTAPPMVGSAFPRRFLEGRDLLYLALHGVPGEPYFYGDGYETALSIDVLKDLDLSHTVVFCAACHFTDTPWLAAFLECRPRLLIAGDGPNYARNVTPVGVHLLGAALRQGLEFRLRPEWAFSYGQLALRYAVSSAFAQTRRATHFHRDTQGLIANQDALLFRAYPQGDNPHV